MTLQEKKERIEKFRDMFYSTEYVQYSGPPKFTPAKDIFAIDSDQVTWDYIKDREELIQMTYGLTSAHT